MNFIEWYNSEKAYVINPAKMRMLKETKENLQNLLNEENIESEVKVDPCPIGLGDAIVSFDADCIIFRDMVKLLCATQYLSNFEIYPIDGQMLHFAGVVSNVSKIIHITDKD